MSGLWATDRNMRAGRAMFMTKPPMMSMSERRNIPKRVAAQPARMHR